MVGCWWLVVGGWLLVVGCSLLHPTGSRAKRVYTLPITPSPQSYRRAVRTSKNKPNANPKKLGSQAATKGDRKPVSPNVRATCNVV